MLTSGIVDQRPELRKKGKPEKQINSSAINKNQSAVSSAVSDSEKKKATEGQSMLFRYGTSCFLQLLDDEPGPSENRLQQIRNERIARAAAKRAKIIQPH